MEISFANKYLPLTHARGDGNDFSALQHVGAWRSLVAYLNGVQKVGGSNPLAPTIFFLGIFFIVAVFVGFIQDVFQRNVFVGAEFRDTDAERKI